MDDLSHYGVVLVTSPLQQEAEAVANPLVKAILSQLWNYIVAAVLDLTKLVGLTS
jgi:hypothetical protein